MESTAYLYNLVELRYPLCTNLSIPFVVVNQYGQIALYSGSAKELYGLSIDQPVGADFTTLNIPNFTRDQFNEIIKNFQANSPNIDKEELLKIIVDFETKGDNFNKEQLLEAIVNQASKSKGYISISPIGVLPFSIINKSNGVKSIIFPFAYPLVDYTTSYVCIIFAIHIDREKKKDTIDLGDSTNPYIQKAQGAIYLFRKSPAVALTLSLLAAGWFIATNLGALSGLSSASKLLPKLDAKPNDGSGNKLNLTTKTKSRIKLELTKLYKSLPPSSYRVYLSTYEYSQNSVYFYISPDMQVTGDSLPNSNSYIKVGDGLRSERFDMHAQSDCYTLVDPGKYNDEFTSAMELRSSYFHISCGIRVNPYASPKPHLAFIAIEGSDPEADLGASKDKIISSLPAFQKILNEN